MKIRIISFFFRWLSHPDPFCLLGRREEAQLGRRRGIPGRVKETSRSEGKKKRERESELKRKKVYAIPARVLNYTSSGERTT